MQKRAEIPSKPRFSLATQRAYSLLAELDIGEFPVDPRKIIKHFPSWHLVGWLELQHNTDEEDPLHLDKEKAEAKTMEIVRVVISSGMLRLKMVTCSLPWIRFQIIISSRVKLVVLMPPPVEPGEAPMNIRPINSRIVAFVS